MQQDLTSAIKKAESQIDEIILLDTKLLTLFQKFPKMSNDEKELALIQYKTLLNERYNLIDPIVSIQEFLNNIIRDLQNVKLSKVDRLAHWLKIRDMKKSVSNLLDFVDDTPNINELEKELDAKNEKKGGQNAK